MVCIVRNAVNKPSQNGIASFEQYGRMKLPADFLGFIEHGNGGIPELNTFRLSGKERLIERFLPLMDEPALDEVNGRYDMAVVETQIGERLAIDAEQIGCKLVPFAAVFSGDFLCFDYRESTTSPSIVLWDHNISDEFTPCTTFVASSFHSLIAALA